ncbi:MAG TPA: LytR C-terminal domain-containing protein [Allosphingosinicella sp.]|nr:LytR C-terminal domain-containing protein [Allosphingosinicella sp.]
MKLRSALLIAAAMAPLVACSSASFRPRPVGQNYVATTDVDLLLAEARAQFRAGNHALAAGNFRRILARAPDSIEAYNGMAAAYDRLGRFDLARRYYEEGLALAPEDPGLRLNYAAALRAHGFEREAALVDLPLAVAQADAPSAPDVIEVADGSVTILLPPAGPAPAPDLTPAATSNASVEIEASPPPTSAQAARELANVVVPPPAPVAAPTNRSSVDIVLPAPAPAPVPTPTERASVDIVLPPPAPAPPRTSAPAIVPVHSWARAAASLLPRAPRASVAVTLPPPASERVPRLERNSLGEVALITRRDPARRAQQLAAARAREGTALPIRQIRSNGREIVWELAAAPATQPSIAAAARRPAIVELRVLNAVGRRGQAGRMGTHLRALGWGQVSAGDATRRRARSYILTTPRQAAEARRLAAQLPFRPWVNMSARSGPIRLVLGYDAVRFDDRLLRTRRSS